MRRRLALLGLALGLLGLLGLLLWPSSDPAPPAPAPPVDLRPLPPALADEALTALFAELPACAAGSDLPACRGLSVIAFRLVSTDGVASAVELQVREGWLSPPLLGCLRRTAAGLRLPAPGPRGELAVEAPIACGPDGRPQVLPLRSERSLSPGEVRPLGRP